MDNPTFQTLLKARLKLASQFVAKSVTLGDESEFAWPKGLKDRILQMNQELDHILFDLEDQKGTDHETLRTRNQL